MAGLELSPETTHAIRAVADQIHAEEPLLDPHGLAATTLDANRLSLFGYDSADKEVIHLVNEHGAERVIDAAARLIDWRAARKQNGEVDGDAESPVDG